MSPLPALLMFVHTMRAVLSSRRIGFATESSDLVLSESEDRQGVSDPQQDEY